MSYVILSYLPLLEEKKQMEKKKRKKKEKTIFLLLLKQGAGLDTVENQLRQTRISCLLFITKNSMTYSRNGKIRIIFLVFLHCKALIQSSSLQCQTRHVTSLPSQEKNGGGTELN